MVHHRPTTFRLEPEDIPGSDAGRDRHRQRNFFRGPGLSPQEAFNRGEVLNNQEARRIEASWTTASYSFAARVM